MNNLKYMYEFLKSGGGGHYYGYSGGEIITQPLLQDLCV